MTAPTAANAPTPFSATISAAHGDADIFLGEFGGAIAGAITQRIVGKLFGKGLGAGAGRSIEEYGEAMARVRARGIGDPCDELAEDLIEELGEGMRVDLTSGDLFKPDPSVLGNFPNALQWKFHAGVLLSNGGVLDPLANLYFSSLEHFAAYWLKDPARATFMHGGRAL